MDTAIEYLNNVSIMALTFFDYIQQTFQFVGINLAVVYKLRHH